MAEGRVVFVEDSVKLEPGLAVTMLHGLALSRDMERVPPELQLSLIHASAYLVQTKRDRTKPLKKGLKLAKAKIAELEKERDESLEKAKKAECELGQVLRREKRKMKEVDEKAYQAGYDRAGQEYIRDARSMVNDEVKMRVPIAYRTGYKDGV
ncbi:hypothetical protein RHMOL_Rhmol09G0103600 [Rhododendron molle]|uniref:Uncharacterized protein n=1 Tax=Rhododendron molle TaxID=49168 RepID=A0ACC0MC17_RHOML|nr:hypothetical protein RHMOL_Rhmol09G0103600 [Rhododendron molle]